MPDLQFLIQEGLQMFGDAIQCNVETPLLTTNAIQFLGHALTSKEQDTWDSCGPLWQTSRAEYAGDYLPYKPVFSDGWSPGYIDEDYQVTAPPPERPLSPIYAATSEIQRKISPSPRRTESYSGNGNDFGPTVDAPMPDYETEANDAFRDQLMDTNATVVMALYPWLPRSRKGL